jgi:AAA+ superfamily predicted ATPase
MNDDLNNWQDRNKQYLSAALNWLRLRLIRLAESSAREKTPLRKNKVTEAQITQAAAVVIKAEQIEPPPTLVILSRRFGLSRFEREVLLLCAAMEFDTHVPALCAQAQDELNYCYPTFSLALALFDEPAWDVLSPERPLRYWRLIEINQPAAQSLVTSPLRIDERIVNYIKGLNYLDDRLVPLLVPFDVPAGETNLSPSQQKVVTSVVQHMKSTMNGRVPVTQLIGLDTLSKQLVAQQAAAALGLHLNRLPAELLPNQAAELEALARLWQRESFLLPIAVYLDAHEPETEVKPEPVKQHTTHPLYRFLARTQGIFFLSSREVRSDLGPVTTVMEVKKPTPAEQQAAWNDTLKEDAADSPPLLSGQFNLNVSTIRQIVKHVSAEPGNNGHIPRERLWDACLVSTGPKLDVLAQRLEPKATWDDIVLPKEAKDLLHQITDQIKQRSKVYDTWGFRKKLNRGLGINALFSGDSGTGKTMAAEVIANELRLKLYRIDLSGVVSKYIGETEKNLRRLFDAAEDGGTILFFDEADALFGKRSEVKDSHDRYANIEINYLLQRMESYSGLAILATNMKSALDEAFMRRLRFIVDFPFPGMKERKIIMQKVFPSEVPKGELDYDRLARLNLTGGSINNVAINAAFVAAHSGGPVTMQLILSAAKAEFRKMERPVKETDFQWQEPERMVS